MTDTSSTLIKTPEQFNKMSIAGRLAAEVLEMIEEHVRAGISTEELNRICHDYIVNKQHAIPAPLNYHGFPKSICTSVNNVVCHGIPSQKTILKDNDIINIDITVIKDGYHGDTSQMFTIGNTDKTSHHLIDITQQALYLAIDMVKPGVFLGDIGYAIQKFSEAHHFSVVREYCGHGIGLAFHEEPQILHFGKPKTGMELKEGMTFTIEPMLNMGKRQTKLNKKDGWTVTTKDGSRSAQWEHTLGVTSDGCTVFTARKNEKYFL
jgi:methionyl aminopeptidase